MAEFLFVILLLSLAGLLPVMGWAAVAFSSGKARERGRGALHWIFLLTLVSLAVSALLSPHSIETMEMMVTAAPPNPLAKWGSRLVSLFLVIASSERIFSWLFQSGRNAIGPRGWLAMAFAVYWLSNVALPALFGARPALSHTYLYALFIGLGILVLTADEARRAVLLARNGLLLFILASFLAILVRPDLVLDRAYFRGLIPGMTFRFAGLAPHANSMGSIAAFSLLLLWAHPFARRLPTAAGWLLGSAALLFSQSKTAWLAFALAALVMLVYGRGASFRRMLERRLQLPVWAVLAMILMPLAVAAAALLMFGGGLDLLARFIDSRQGENLLTLTGRFDIWRIAFAEWQRYPVFGYGPTLWNLDYRLAIGELSAFHAHNQMLEALAMAGTLGAAGLLAYFIALFAAVRRTAAASAGLSMAFFLFVMLRAVTEVPLNILDYGPEQLAHFLLLVLIVANLPEARAGLRLQAAGATPAPAAPVVPPDPSTPPATPAPSAQPPAPDPAARHDPPAPPPSPAPAAPAAAAEARPDAATPRCSVIVPLYNKAEYIADTLRSALGQTHAPHEIIVIDDGSSDGGADIARALGDPHIRVLSQANAGVSAARNRGIDEASGDLVCFLDADDWWHPRHLETIVAMARRHPRYEAFTTRHRALGGADFPGTAWEETPAAGDIAVEDFAAHWLAGAPPHNTSSFAVRRAAAMALQPCFPPGENFGEDLDFFFRLNERGPVVVGRARTVAYRTGIAGALSSSWTRPRVAPFIERLDERARQGAIPAPLRASRRLFALKDRVALSRRLMAGGERRAALPVILGALPYGLLQRSFWLTLAMLPAPRGWILRWDRWREDTALAAMERPGAERPLRLLMVTEETWPTFRLDIAALFGKYLPRLGIGSNLVAGITAGAPPESWGGGEAMLFDKSGGRAGKNLRAFFHILRQLWRAGPAHYDAIQVRDLPLPALLGLCAARFKKLPFFYWMSYPIPEAHLERARHAGADLRKSLFPWLRGQFGRLILYKLVLPRADHVFVQSARMKEDMAAFGVPADKMTPVPMGVDFEALAADGIPPVDDPRLAGRRVLAYLGTLVPPRRIEVLFDMLAEVRKAEPAALLVLAGDTDDDAHRERLLAAAQAAGVAEHVILTGWLPMREGWRWVRAAEVGLSPFPRGFLLDSASPTKVLEYLALGVPVVCNDNPDQQRLIVASGAGRCVPYTAAAFASAVLGLLALDAPARVAMAERGRGLVEAERSYARIAGEVAACYRRRIAAHRSRRAAP